MHSWLNLEQHLNFNIGNKVDKADYDRTRNLLFPDKSWLLINHCLHFNKKASNPIIIQGLTGSKRAKLSTKLPQHGKHRKHRKHGTSTKFSVSYNLYIRISFIKLGKLVFLLLEQTLICWKIMEYEILGTNTARQYSWRWHKRRKERFAQNVAFQKGNLNRKKKILDPCCS